MSLTGDPDGPPTKSGLSLVDLSGGYVAAIALLAGIHRAQRDGVGCDADVSLFETALAELMYVGTWAATHGHDTPRRANSAHPSIVPFQAFATADGHITIAAGKQHFWTRLCQAIERPDLLEDPALRELRAARRAPRRAPRGARRRVRLPAERPLGRVARRRRRPRRARQRRGRGAGGSADHRARGVVESSIPNLGTVRQTATPLRLSGELPEPSRAPFLGEHTEELLRELCGYTDERTSALREAGAFGDHRVPVPDPPAA